MDLFKSCLRTFRRSFGGTTHLFLELARDENGRAVTKPQPNFEKQLWQMPYHQLDVMDVSWSPYTFTSNWWY
jgi:hypothetical protein